MWTVDESEFYKRRPQRSNATSRSVRNAGERSESPAGMTDVFQGGSISTDAMNALQQEHLFNLAADIFAAQTTAQSTMCISGELIDKI